MGKLSFFLKPKSVCVVGASGVQGKVGYTVLNNVINSTKGTDVKIYPINPKGGVICGLQAYKSVLECPEAPELAVFVIPSKFCIKSAEECGQKGVKGLVVITAGFKEVGGAGVELEHQLVEIGKKYNMRILGPNILGVANPQFNCTFCSSEVKPGSIAFISQSGAFLSAILDYSLTQPSIGFSQFCSIGNKCDVHELDLIEEIADDPNTKIILLYLESIIDGKSFLEKVPDACKKKPIIIIKSGRSKLGAAAASSHTGALAGNDISFDLAFNKCGVLRAQTMDQIFSLAKLFQNINFDNLKPVEDRKFAIVTNAGGPGIVATDAFEAHHVSVAQFSQEIKDKLRSVLPAEASVKNPIDVVGDAPPKRYEDSIRIAFEDPNVHGALVLVTPQAQTQPEEVAKLCVKLQEEYKDKIIVTAFMGGASMVEPGKILQDGKISNYDFPEPAIEAIKAVCDYAKVRQGSCVQYTEQDYCGFTEEKVAKIEKIFENVKAEGRTVLTSYETSAIFRAIGVPAPKTELAKTAEECGKYFKEMGCEKVVLKIVSPQIMHKSDCGGVLLGIDSVEKAEEGFRTIMKNAAERGPKGAQLIGVECQEMVDFKKMSKTTEMIVGMNRDANFGPMLMVGQGGVYANYIKDVCFELAYKYTEANAYAQLEKTKIYSILKGVRGEPKSAIKQLVDL